MTWTEGVTPTEEPRSEADLVATLNAELRHHPEVELALLFGSRARGRECGDSDVDVTVEGEAVDRLALAQGLSAAVGLEVDVVDLRRAGHPLLQALLCDGVVLHAETRFRTRVILRTETDRRRYERMRDAYLKHMAERRGDGP